jgi:hypothetical protein
MATVDAILQQYLAGTVPGHGLSLTEVHFTHGFSSTTKGRLAGTYTSHPSTSAPMDTHSNPYLPDFGEPASSPNSPLYSVAPSPSLSLVSTPASTVLDLPKEVARNPHDLPVFGEKTLTNPSEPILYLPPFLSSLPPAHVNTMLPISTGRIPKRTEAHLPDIDGPSLSLHKALHNFAPITEKYASSSYADTFNWDELDLPEEDEHEWYCVAFKSIRKPGSENDRQPTSLLLPDFR